MKRSVRFAAARFGIGACIAFAQAPAVHAQEISAETILRQMAQAYAEANSYSDHGTAIYRNSDGTERMTVEFLLWLARPGNFRVDATSRSPGAEVPRREVLWSDGTTVRTWSSDKPVATLERVRLVGSGMFSTYAYHVPSLLEPEYGTVGRLEQLTSPEFAGEEAVDGVDCHRIRGQFHGDPYELWIGKADHLLRKLRAKYRDNELEEFHREIAVNQPLTLGVFRFAPENEQQPGAMKSPEPSPRKKR